VNEPSFPLPGTIITYVDPDATGSALFCRAVSDGPAILDPATGDFWLPARTPDRAAVLLDPLLVMHRTPGPDTDDRVGADTAGSTDVLRTALDTAVRGLVELDAEAPTALGTARALLTEFIDAIEPVQEALFTLVDAEPNGRLAEVLACLIHAAAHLGTGDVAAGRTAMSAAYHILIRWRPERTFRRRESC
jgi:hypothetical protein